MKRICIDIGHGGLDPGSSGNHMLEKKINYNVAHKLQELLKRAGFEVFLTRMNDETIDISRRAKIANNLNVDLIISVHHNAGGGHGYDVIYNIAKPASEKVALLIADEFKKLGQTKHRVFSRENAYGTDYYAIQRLTKAPCVITEFAFIDTDDGKDIDTLTEQWGEAQAISNAVKKYYGG